MANCNNEIIGIKKIALYVNNGARFERPDITVEDEVNLIVTENDNFLITDVITGMKWERTIAFSGNYKQNYLDEFTFKLHGVENDIPGLIKKFRTNRLGYIIEIETIGHKSLVFQSPVFLNVRNTKQIDSHTWNVSFSYRVPSFLKELILLNVITASQPEQIINNTEITGVRKMALYINDNVRIRRPNPAIEDEVDLIAHGTGSFIIDEVIEQPKWKRNTTFSGNYRPNYSDEFTFILHGIENDVPFILESLRNNRLGYIVEIITTGNESFVFPAPVFLDSKNIKRIDSHSWKISLNYRVPTFQDKLKKLNTILMTQSYILIGDNQILGDGQGRPIVAS